jgi:peroxiredoxin
VTLYKDSLSSSLVTGSEENELFYTYRNTSRQINKKKSKLRAALRKAQQETDGIMAEKHLDEIKQMDANFISDRKNILEQHSDKMVAIAALSDLINAKVITGEETGTYFDALSDDVKKTSIGVSIERYIAQQNAQKMASKLASVGNKAPEFSAATPDGKELALSETLGEYTIIDFWASWCKPCRIENPNVVRVYNKYHKKGLNIVSVSLDRPGQKDRWVKAIEKDKMDWYHVSNLKYWQDPIPRSYGVRSIPSTFLLDKNGVIIAKNLRGRALEAKMAELLGS